MGARSARRRWLWGGAVSVAFLFYACGAESVGPDPALAPFVGDWDATRLVLTSVANPQMKPDLVALGASFRLNVQPSGQYTAVLVYAEQASTEIGRLSVSGNTLTLSRDFPSRSTSNAVYVLVGNRLTLDGDTEFDFNLDGTPEAALAHFELSRR